MRDEYDKFLHQTILLGEFWIFWKVSNVQKWRFHVRFILLDVPSAFEKQNEILNGSIVQN